MSVVNVEMDGITFPSSDHAYQFHKAITSKDKQRLLKAKTPYDVKRISKLVEIRPDWDLIKEDIMYKCVKAKFTQNEDYNIALCMTHPHELVEGNWWGDTEWGVCNGVGKNKLGKILMRVRNELC